VATSFLPSPTLVLTSPGDYAAALVVTDANGSQGVASVDIAVDPCGSHDPVIDAVTVTPTPAVLDQPVVLDVAAADPDADLAGCDTGGLLSLSTTFLSRPAGSSSTLTPAVGATPSFVPDVLGPYSLRVTVTDDTGRSAAAVVDIAVNCGGATPVVSSVGATPATPHVSDAITLTIQVGDADNGPGCALGQSQTLEVAVSGPAGSSPALTLESELPGNPQVDTYTLTTDLGAATPSAWWPPIPPGARPAARQSWS